MRYKTIIADSNTTANKGMRLDARPVSDIHIILDFNKGTNHTATAYPTFIEIREIPDDSITPNLYIPADDMFLIKVQFLWRFNLDHRPDPKYDIIPEPSLCVSGQ
jgi:hypothetical protein